MPLLLLVVHVIVPVGLIPDTVAVQVTSEPAVVELGEQERLRFTGVLGVPAGLSNG